MKIEEASQLLPQAEQLADVVRRFSQNKRITVVGDLVADQFLYGEISRVSREAPVLILHHERTETLPGGAANCAVNVAALGARVSLIGVVGEDEAGRALLEKLRAANVDCAGVISLPNAQTTTKVRVLAGQIHSTRQQVLRVDYENARAVEHDLRETLRARLREAARVAAAVIISDYNYGVADVDMAAAVRAATHGRDVAVIVDSRFKLARFPGFTSATPNEDEVEKLLSEQLTDKGDLEAAGERLRGQLNYQALLITRGSNGMMLFQAEAKPLSLKAVGAREPVDVTGAGDTVIAAYTLALASGATFADAARIANHAGGLVVMKRGTASITNQELLSSVLHN